jgi:hypothetical protein
MFHPSTRRKDGYSLGAWTSSQRHQGNTKLTKEQVDLLEQIPGWTWAGNRESVWDKVYELLKEHCKKEGSARVYQHYRSEDGYALGTWVRTQRQNYKFGKLSKERQKLVERLPGWVWEARKGRWSTG